MVISGEEPSRLVRGRVTRHENYGFMIDFGEDQEGVVVITMIADDSVASPDFPRIGSEVEAVLLGYTEFGGQPRLSVRPKDIVKAVGG
ncbi:S1 RNA-binding domain-containing protein [Microlunatus speluncae]|uniref:S1 RNA-binding domain-containing protein n=1 Tax=Microlunatus speluncae TaxID=2594267 RepID=UPI001375E737|nr:S1 RNA-binding domain-containing protein [Microlunatus speluncae]